MSEVLIVGSGFSGMSAALTLADRGVKVNLIDSKPAMGGFFPFLDNQFPTNSCGVCFLSPTPPAYCPFIECTMRDNVNFIPNSELTGVTGVKGSFNVKIKIKNNPVNNDLCIDCGKCESVCPVEVGNELVDGIETRKAVFKFYPKNVKKSYYLDILNCNKCNKCVEICPTDAINLDADNSEDRELTVSDIILTPGFKAVKGNIKEEFGFGVNKNVLSSIQYERLISPSGPTLGKPERPSDKTVPKKIAFLQCVGSRDIRKQGNPFCSSVCCMFALKQAIFTKKQVPEAEIVFFYMDIRAFGKNYEEYFNEAKEKYGIKFIRCHVSTIKEHGKENIITVTFYENGEFKEKDFDLAVLSLGFYQDGETENLLKIAKIESNEYNFAKISEFQPVSTNIDGIYAAGSFTAPRDIPEATMEGTAAAAKVLEELTIEDSGSEPLVSVRNPEEPRVGFIICKCGNILEHSLDLDKIIQNAKNVKDVVFTEITDSLCNGETIDNFKKIIADNALNKVVVAGCSVRELQFIFDKFCKESGYSTLDFEFVNLREQCVFCSEENNSKMLTEKSVNLTKAAIGKVLKNRNHKVATEEINKSVMVIGGGVAGLTSALNLANQGFKVFIVEKKEILGGRLVNAHYTIKGSDIKENLKVLIDEVNESKNIEILTSAEIVKSEGIVGSRKTTIKIGEDERIVEHGAVIIATGGKEVTPSSYEYNESDKIVTQVELEDKIFNGEIDADVKEVVMIQCVESREKGAREYCSRVCCTHALKNAVKLKEANPDINITVLYRDIRAYGFYENYYREAREKGVIFIPYTVENKPVVKVDGSVVSVTFEDTIIKEKISKNIDMLVLSTGVDANPNGKLADIFGLPIDKNGFFEEANKKTGLTNFLQKDIFMAGLCHAPKHIEEAVVQSYAASGRASVFLSKNNMKAIEKISFVVERFCSCCGICVDICPFNARVLDLENKVAKVYDTVCEGCGACVMACPNGAAQQYGFEKEQILEYVDNLL